MDIVDVSISSFTVRCEGYLLSFSWRYVFLGAVGGKCLEKVYLLVFCLRKVRKMTKNAEAAKNTIQTVVDPSFFHTMLGGALGNRASKKARKNMLPARYGHAKNDLPPPKTAYRFQARFRPGIPDLGIFF